MGLGASTSPEIAGRIDAGPPLLVVPVGSVEQHGAHLPLDTDTRVAEAVVAVFALRWAGCVVAPAVAYGASG